MPSAPVPQHRSTMTGGCPGGASRSPSGRGTRCAARHEDARVDEDPQAGELGPADYLLQRQPGYPPGDHGVKLPGRRRGASEEGGLILREHAPGGSEPGHDRRRGSHHAATIRHPPSGGNDFTLARRR